MTKIRLDVYLTQKGMTQSRERAKALIMAGQVYIKNQKCDKAGTLIDESATAVEIRGDQLKYVSRGGLKLEKALMLFPIDLAGKTAMDIGASTGGFTDCMLQNGASKVYSVDVGHGQLDWKLRNDDRVVCMEKTNFRYMKREDIEDDIDFASCDVSFISLSKILIPARSLLKAGGEMVCLIKPQFEAGKDKVGKKGVVRDPQVHEEVVEKICAYVGIVGFDILALDYSPIKGPEGNIEYLIHLKKNDDNIELEEHDAEQMLKAMTEEKKHIVDDIRLKEIKEIVASAHGSLDRDQD